MKKTYTPTLKGVISLLLLCNFSFIGLFSAQDTLRTPSGAGAKPFITVSTHYGFIMAHNPNMEYLIKSHIGGGEVSLALQTQGEKNWERVYNNPEKGLGFYLAELGNPLQLGQAIGLFPFVNFPLNPGRKFKLFVRTGNGLGLITKPYEKKLNHKNNINGSYFNEFIYLRLYSVFHPFKNIQMQTGVGLTHLSNGNWAVPNLGINIMTMNLGLRFYKFDSQKGIPKTARDTSSEKISKKLFVTTNFLSGINETNYRNGKKYGTFALTLSVWKTVSPKSRFCAGNDLFYYMSNLAKAEEKGTFDTSNKLNNLQAGFRLGYEIVVGKIALPIEMGTYYYTKTTADGSFYHRVGLRVYMTKRLILNYTLKTHWFTAENIEFGAGYRF
ncbi:MAG: hypothetical protein EPN85_04790 [Bacteroidetes bacterium]|nr:MAG: hypothetical protein EPN85_04790 [Bacteroidota bacterium]